MMLRNRIVIVCTACLALSVTMIGRAAVNPAALWPDRLIVELEPGNNINDINADYGTVTIAAVADRNLYLLAVPPGNDLEQFAEELNQDNRVEEAEQDDDCLSPEATGGDTQPIFFFVPPGEFSEQYATSMLGLEAAHAWSTGTGIVVAIVDTGVDADHPLLAGRIEPGGYNFINGNTNTDDVGNGIDGDGDVQVDEMVGHGTFLAGVVATVAPDATILPVRVLDPEGYSDVFRLVQGIYHAIDAGADVICLGLGTRSHNHILRDSLDEAYDAGIVVVAAAGNEDAEHPVQLPAGHDTVIGVASTDADDVKSDFSNYGEYIALTAPGPGIVSSMPGGLYAEASGTSISTAFVAGAAALVRSQRPLFDPENVASRLLEAAQDIDAENPGYVGLLGAGRLDAAAAIDPGRILNGFTALPIVGGDPWDIAMETLLPDLLILLGEGELDPGLLYQEPGD